MRALLQEEAGGPGGRRDDDGMELRCNPLGRWCGEAAESALNLPAGCLNNPDHPQGSPFPGFPDRKSAWQPTRKRPRRQRDTGAECGAGERAVFSAREAHRLVALLCDVAGIEGEAHGQGACRPTKAGRRSPSTAIWRRRLPRKLRKPGSWRSRTRRFRRSSSSGLAARGGIPSCHTLRVIAPTRLT